MDHTTPAANPDDEVIGDDSPRLARYVARTETPLDLLALATLWIVLVPPSDFGPSQRAVTFAWVTRIAVSVVYGIDLTIRTALANRRAHYLATHPLMIASVFAPPVRVIFSIRLVRSVFRRGSLRRFLLAATVLVLEGSIIVYLYERHAAGSDIRTLGESVWWSFVTVTTVGYGDYVPVTPQGRITACFVMGIGLLTLAVITAQVSSSFVSQGRTTDTPTPPGEPADANRTLGELNERLARIESLLGQLALAPTARTAGDATDGSP